MADNKPLGIHHASISQEYHVLNQSLDILSFPAVVDGRIDEEIMRNALQTLVNQHPALRTRFIVTQGQVKREVLPTIHLPLTFLYKSYQSEKELHDFIFEYAELQKNTLPKRDQGPLFSCAFIQTDPQSSIFLLTIDHIICDALSIKLFCDELFSNYDHPEKKSAELITISEDTFTDFVIWQRNKVEKMRDEISAFWSKKIMTATHEGTIIKKNNNLSTLKRQKINLSEELTTALVNKAKDHRVSLFTFLLATFKLLLYTTHQQNTLIRIVHSGRYRQQWKSAIGLFASSMYIDIPIQGKDNLPTLLKTTHQSLYHSFKWGFAPIEYLESIGNPLSAQSMIVEMDYMPIDPFTCSGQLLKVNPLFDASLGGLQPNLDIQLLCYHKNKELCLYVIYREALSSQSSDNLLFSFESLINQLLENPTLRLEQLTMESSA